MDYQVSIPPAVLGGAIVSHEYRPGGSIDELTARMNELDLLDPRLEGYRPTAVFGPELFVRLTLEDTLVVKPHLYASRAHFQDTFRVSGLFLEFLSKHGWMDPSACQAIKSALRDVRRRIVMR